MAALALFAAGCRSAGPTAGSDYVTIAEDPRRDTQAARLRNARAARLIEEGKLDEAEKHLRAALAADLFFGPAHNNLGTVYFRQEKHYLAAWEFQYAAKLMPNKAEPRSNLGLVFEAVGRLDEAADWYEKAIALEPENVQIAGNLARAYVRLNRKDDRTRQLLKDIALKDTRPRWRAWAQERLLAIGASPAPAGAP
jgi:Flp pilus assembly protein TadD